nr:MAG TPA: hypothetical protein [Caudoviricetes sp.]
MSAKFRSDNMSGTTLGKNLVAIKYQPSGVDTAIENGHIVVVGDLITGETDVRKATTPAANSAINTLAVVGGVAVDKTKSYNAAGDYTNPAGVATRAYRLRTGDFYAVTADALSAAADIAVGNIVEAQADTKAKVVATLTTGSTKIGTVYAIEGEWIVIEVA